MRVEKILGRDTLLNLQTHNLSGDLGYGRVIWVTRVGDLKDHMITF